MGFGDDVEFPVSHVERLVNPWCSTVDDNQLRTVPRDQSLDDLLCEVDATPMSVAGDQDTHVHIVAGLENG